MTDRHTVDTINDDQLDQLYDDLDHARAALTHNDRPAGTWLHVAFTSPDETSANTSALAIADHLAAEFPGVRMRITSNATEADPFSYEERERTGRNVGLTFQTATEATDVRTRVTALYEQWVKAGAPPLGVPMARLWDRRLVELHAAIRPADESERTTPDNPPTSSNTPDNPLEERIRTLIESEMYEYRERTMFWPEGGVTEEIARLATRGALEALGVPADAQPRDETADEDDDLTGAWTPDPPIGCLNLGQPKED